MPVITLFAEGLHTVSRNFLRIAWRQESFSLAGDKSYMDNYSFLSICVIQISHL